MTPTDEDRAARNQVARAVLEAIESGSTIRLPAFDPALSAPSERFALTGVGREPNPYGGTVGPYRYQFEGEEDLLHLIVVRRDGGALTPAEGQAVAAFLLDGVPPALVWIRPGELTQHFYVGHDDLVGSLVVPAS